MVGIRASLFAFPLLVAPALAAECLVPIEADGRIDPARMAVALAECAQNAGVAGGVNPPKAEAPPAAVWAEVADFGRYEPVMSTPESGGASRITGYRHADWSREIKARIGTVIGLRAAIYAPGPASGELDLVVIHPPFGGDGSGDPVTEVTRKALTNGKVEMHAFVFEAEAELVPGIWRFEIRQAGSILAAQSFVLSR